MTYIIIFETDNPTVEENLIGAIKAFGEWAITTSQSCLLDTTHDVRTIMESLHPMLRPKDSLWVFTASSPWCGHGDPIVEDHVEGYLGNADDYIPKD